MAEASFVPAKMCVVCGQNVADKPRVKDAAGRYMCKACAEKQTAAKPATAVRPAAGPPSASTRPAAKTSEKGAIPMAPEPGFDPVMASLVASSKQATSISCPNCKGWVKEGQLLCTSCGFNLEEGKQVRTRVQREKAPKEPKGARKSPLAGLGSSMAVPIIVGVGMFALTVGALGFAIGNQAMFPLLLVYFVCALVLSIAILIEAYRVSPGTLLLLLVSQLVPIAGLVLYLHFLLVKCESPSVKFGGLGMMLGSLVGMVILFTTQPQVLREYRDRERDVVMPIGVDRR